MNRTFRKKVGGFSLVETVIVIAVLGLLAAAGIGIVSNGVFTGANDTRMAADQRVLNSAVKAYLASGGDLSGLSDPVEVVAHLKRSLSEEQRRLLPGLTGGFLDPDTELVMQSKEDARREALRVHWNEKTSRFELARSGAPGIVGVTRVEPEIGKMREVEATEGRGSVYNYAKEGTWVWDYRDESRSLPVGPTEFVVETVAESPVPPPSPPPPVIPPPVRRDSLLPPLFSLPGGRYHGHEFDLTLNLANPNPGGLSQLVYSVDYGDWQPYAEGSPISVAPATLIKAQAIPLDSAVWDPSPVEEEFYVSFRSVLLPPEIDFNKTSFSGGSDTIRVTLDDANDPGLSALRYQIVPTPRGAGPSTAFTTYAGPFTVSASTYPDGFGIKAFASATKAGYEDSRVAARFATARTDLFGGHLDLDTSTFAARIGSGRTDAHTHDILKKIGGTSINFFAIPESKQIEITEAISNPGQKFKLIVVNGNLSPGMNLVIDYGTGGRSHSLDLSVDRYDDTPVEDLEVMSLSGVPGSARLKGLRIQMNQDLIYNAGVIPTNTGDVVSNVLGKDGEWRNGALTIQAVAVNGDGSSAYSINEGLSNGNHGAAVSGMLWEAAIFWHWSGDSYHEKRNRFEPGKFNSIRPFVEK